MKKTYKSPLWQLQIASASDIITLSAVASHDGDEIVWPGSEDDM